MNTSRMWSLLAALLLTMTVVQYGCGEGQRERIKPPAPMRADPEYVALEPEPIWQVETFEVKSFTNTSITVYDLTRGGAVSSLSLSLDPGYQPLSQYLTELGEKPRVIIDRCISNCGGQMNKRLFRGFLLDVSGTVILANKDRVIIDTKSALGVIFISSGTQQFQLQFPPTDSEPITIEDVRVHLNTTRSSSQRYTGIWDPQVKIAIKDPR